MPNTKTVSKDILRDEWDLPFGGTEEIEIVSDELRHSNRWSNTFELVIHDKRDDMYWSDTGLSVPRDCGKILHREGEEKT